MENNEPIRTPRDVIVLRSLLGFVVGAVAMFGIWLGYVYAYSPAAIRNPTQAHYHFRLQVLSNGKPVNFADSQYQTEFSKDICSANLTKEPFHFHDDVDQFVHVHWNHVTGGLLLKHYGWNFIGGPDTTLGYKFNGFSFPQRVPIHGQVLPAPARDANYYIYVGNADTHRQASWADFLHRDLKDYFATTAGQPSQPAVIGAQEDSNRARINNVIGSAVIFAQKDKPTEQQIQDRFSKLTPLPESSCSG